MNIGDGISSPAIEQDPGIAQLQARQTAVNDLLASLPVGAFVSSLNGLVGTLNLTAGTSSPGVVVTIATDGLNTISIGVSIPSTGLALNVTSITFANSPYTMTNTNDVLLVNDTGGTVEVNLHSAATAEQKNYTIKKVNTSANAVNINSSDLIDGSATLTETTQYTSYTLVPSNSVGSWNIV